MTDTLRLITRRHPFAERVIEDVVAGESVTALVERTGRDPRLAHVVVDGEPLARELWALTVPGSGSTVIVTQVPQWGAVFTAIALAGAAAGVYMGFQARRQMRANERRLEALSEAQASQSQSLRGARNRFAKYEPIPVVLGEHLVTPFFGAQPWTEIEGNDEYMRLLFVIGYGPLQISDMRIGDTPLSQFQDVEVEVREGWDDDEPITLFPDSVSEEYVDTELVLNDSMIRTTAPDVTEIGVDFLWPQGLFRVNDKGRVRSTNTTLRVEYRSAGSGSWTLAQERNYGASQNRAMRRGVRWSVPKGQYDVRVTLTSQNQSQNRINSVMWGVLRSISPLPDGQRIIPQGMAAVALRIRHSDQLQGVVDEFNCKARSYVRDWNDNWVLSSNPALLYRHLMQGTFNARPLDDARIDFEMLQEWEAYCDQRGFECNAVIDTQFTLYRALSDVANTGRATFGMRDNRYSAVVDRPQTAPAQQFTPRNSWDFRGTRAFEEELHGVKVRFVNKEAGYQRDEIIVYATGYDANTARLFESIELWGVTDYDQAYREGRFLLAVRALRRESWQVNVDWEHLVTNRGDLVRLQHDVMLVGLSAGRVKSVDSNGAVLDEICPMEEGKQYGIVFRRYDGTEIRVPVVTDPGEPREISFAETPAELPSVGDLALFGEWGAEYIDAIIDSIEPRGELEAQINLIPAAPQVHDVDSEIIPPFESVITLPPEMNEPRPEPPEIVSVETEISGILIGTQLRQETRLRLSISPHSGRYRIAYYEAESRILGGVTWERHGQATGSDIAVGPVERGETYDVRVRAVNRQNEASAWTTIENIKVADQIELDVPDIRGLELDGQANDTEFVGRAPRFAWRKSSMSEWYQIGYEPTSQGAGAGALDLYFKDYEVRVFAADGTHLHTDWTTDPWYTYEYEQNVEDSLREGLGGPQRSLTVEVYHRGRQNQLSRNPAKLRVSNPAPELPGGWSLERGFFDAEAKFTQPDDTDFRRVNVYLSTQQGFTPSAENLIAQGADSPLKIGPLTQSTTYYYRYEAEDAFGPGAMSGELSFETKQLEPQDVNVGPWGQIPDGDREQIENWLAGHPDEFGEPLYQPIVVAGQLRTGTLNATETITAEGLIRVVSGPDGEYQTTMGPQERGGTLYAFNAWDGNIVRAGIRADGTLEAIGAEIEGAVTAGGLTVGDSGTIRLQNDSGLTLAGITAQGDGDTSTRIWAGATFANRADAPFRVTQGGKLVATGATISGTFRTSETGRRFVLDPTDNTAKFFGADGDEQVSFGSVSFGQYSALRVSTPSGSGGISARSENGVAISAQIHDPSGVRPAFSSSVTYSGLGIVHNIVELSADDYAGVFQGPVLIESDLEVTGGKNFLIPHPTKSGAMLRHGAYEGPVPGGNIYRYRLGVEDGGAVLDLPDYFNLINKDPQVICQPVKHFGVAYGEVSGNRLTVTASGDGEYDVVIFATRDDPGVQEWYEHGVELPRKDRG